MIGHEKRNQISVFIYKVNCDTTSHLFRKTTSMCSVYIALCPGFGWDKVLS